IIAARQDGLVVAATDNNAQGDVYADRLRGIAAEMGCDFQRLRPHREDWNEELRARRRENSRG
ncbi:toprim domain-containing protein, partial [Rhizobium sp. CCGE 510]|uniref:toprim domain-containing protein n=1 Tax=Rhizobium sp. CCGE 510 TaxID=1132836 RepID=UPI00178C2ECF